MRDRVTLKVSDLVPDRLYHYALRPLDSAGGAGALSNVAQSRTSKDKLDPAGLAVARRALWAVGA